MERRTLYNMLMALMIFVLANTLTSCVYLRLLKVKRQFRHFERYVRIDESHGLAMLLSEPVLQESDVIWLLEGEAAIQARSGRYSLLKYDFEKLLPAGASEHVQGVPIAMNMHFQDGTLYKLRFPKNFSKHLKPALLKGSLQSMGQGMVNKEEKSVSATMRLPDASTSQEPQEPIIPTRPEVERILGKPSQLTETASTSLLYYQYAIRIRRDAADEQLPRFQIWLHFSRENQKLSIAKASFHGMSTTIAFQ